MSTTQTDTVRPIFAKGAAAWARLRRLPGFRRRRIRVWAIVVMSITIVLGIQALMPSWHLIPQLAGNAAAATTLLMFLAAMVAALPSTGCSELDSERD